MKKALKTIWTQHLPPEEKEDFEKLIGYSTRVLSRVKQMIEIRERDILSLETKQEEYHNPSWAYKQAHLNGRKAELKELKELFNFL